MRQTKPLSERFWSKVDRRGPQECWPWTGALISKGYGDVFTGGKPRHEYAHRVALQLAGYDTDGMCVCHRCDNPRCCNPAHLFLGTHGDNARDKQQKGRAAKKLTAADVLEMRAQCAAGATKASLARKWLVDERAVFSIVNREHWSHV